MKRFWLSWVNHTNIGFTMHWPWWRTGYDSADSPIYVAAVMVFDEEDAWSIVRRCHHLPDLEIEERFIEEKPRDWKPYCDRFPEAAHWMMWPKVSG